MTPDQLNDVMARVRDELEEEALPTLAASYERVLRSAGRRMAKRMRAHSHVTDAHRDTHAVTAASFVPPDEDEVVDAGRLAEQVAKQNAKERKAAVKAISDSLSSHGIAWDIHGNFTPELMATVGARATFAAEQELREVYRSTIAEAAEQGWSIPRTAGAIVENVDGTAGYRATALARTDLIGLANGASQDAAKDAFAEREDVTKVWLATDDERTRDSHLDANGQEVPLNEYFDVGGFPLSYPGDPDGPDEEVINCRCTLVYSGGSGSDEAAAEEGLPEEGEAAFTDLLIEEMVKPIENPGVASATEAFAVRLDPETLDAVRQMSYPPGMEIKDPVTAAVTITVDGEAADQVEAETRTPWEGILAIEGHPTSDGRYLIPGEIDYRVLPLPIAPSHQKQQETETVGRIETITRVPVSEFDDAGWDLPEMAAHAAIIWGEGTFDGSPGADDALRQLENGVGISLDLPTERQALIDAVTYEEVDPSTLSEEDMLALALGMLPEGYLRGFAGKIGGASLASIAAFEESRIRLIDNVALVASGFAIREVEPEPQLFVIAPGSGGLVASAQAPLAPPRDWFFMEEADEPTPLTITPDGRVYGHLALWNTCHAGRANGAFSSCMYAPHSPSGYKQFHLGAILCEDGSEVAIGRITVDTGHAALHLGAAAARRHYDDTGTCAALVRAADGVFGIWICGVAKSDATPEQIRDMRACPPSGDWRIVDHALELQAALSVNVAGFPVPRSQLALAASGADLEVATLILGAPEHDDFREALQAEVEGDFEDNVSMLFFVGDDAGLPPAA